MSQEQQPAAGGQVPSTHGSGADERASEASVGVTPPAPDQAQQASPDRTSTGRDPRVEDALSRMSELDALPLSEQVEVYTDVHRRLAGVLADPDSQAQ